MGQATTSMRMPYYIASLNADQFLHKKYQVPDSDDALIDSTGMRYWYPVIESHTEINEVTQFGHDIMSPLTSVSTERHQRLSEHLVAERFGIGLERARATIRATTQKGIRSAIMPLSRMYKTDRFYHTKRLMGKFSTETVYFKVKTLHMSGLRYLHISAALTLLIICLESMVIK